MKLSVRVVFAWMIAMAAVGAAAQQVCYEYTATLYNKTGRGPDVSTACSGLSGATWTIVPGVTATATSVTGDSSGQCTYYYTANDPAYSGSGVVGTQRIDKPCPDECGDTTTASVKNVTIGYTRNRTDNQVVGTPFNPWAADATACDGKCSVRFGSALGAYQSETKTAQGLYRNSVDMESYNTGASCTAISDPLSATQTGGPSCPGSLGTVNGQPYCAGTAQQPVSNDKPMPPQAPSPTDGNPTAGSGPTPGAGPSDRTPTVGSGGPEGGPRGAGSSGGGTTGSGTAGTIARPASGTVQAACGAPGQPKCAIDETGTPSKADATSSFTNAGKAVDDTEKGIKDAIASIKDQAKPEWTWSFQLPTVCNSFVLDEFNITIDMCQWQPIIHDLMAIVWIGATIWFGIAIVGRTLGGGH